MEKAERAILKKHDFQMDSHRYEIFGLCRDCSGDRQAE
jgi:Fe2+ or Zn2+ uptake regulation protein